MNSHPTPTIMSSFKSRIAKISILLLPVLFHPTVLSGQECEEKISEAEKLICKDDELIMLQEKYETAYRHAMVLATPDIKQNLEKSRDFWVNSRLKKCNTKVCVQRVFWSQLAAFDEKSQADGNSWLNANVDSLRTLVKKHKFQPSQPLKYCASLLDYIKNGKEISFVNPTIVSQSINNSIIEREQSECNSDDELNFMVACRISAGQTIDWIDAQTSDDLIESGCDIFYGIGPFAIFNLPSEKNIKSKKIFLVSNVIGHINDYWTRPNLGLGPRFHEFDKNHCEGGSGMASMDVYLGGDNKKSALGISIINSKYYMIGFGTTDDKRAFLSLHDILENKQCDWLETNGNSK